VEGGGSGEKLSEMKKWVSVQTNYNVLGGYNAWQGRRKKKGVYPFPLGDKKLLKSNWKGKVSDGRVEG